MAGAAGRIGSSAIRNLLALSERPGVISLAGGKPTPDAFPVEDVRTATDAVLACQGAAALQYSATEGYGPLREWLAARHAASAGSVAATVDRGQVTVTSGAQQGLDLVARALVGAGDVVVMADPGYVGAIQAFRLAGAEVMGIPDDGDGIRVDVLADRLADGLRPCAAYLIPNLSNPTGATLTDDCRAALVALAERYDFWLIEDDPYGALRWAGRAPIPLAARSDRVITVGTVSKVLCPGLRVGYVVAPPPVTDAVVLVKQAADLHTSTLTQRVVHELVTRPGFLDDHLDRLPGHYRTQAAALTTGLRRHLGETLAFTEPDGGMFVWAQVTADPDSGMDTSQLLDVALDAGVAFVPGVAFAVSRRHDDRLRLSFAEPTPAEIEEGVRRLASVLLPGPRSRRAVAE